MHPLFPRTFRSLSGQPPAHLMVSLVSVNLFWSAVTYGQRSAATFGPSVEISLPGTPVALAIHRESPSGPPLLAVGFQESSHLRFYRFEGNTIVAGDSVRVPFPPAFVASRDLDADGRDELVMLPVSGVSVAVVDRDPGARRTAEYSLDTRAGRVTIADWNSDGILDLGLHGRRMSGLATFAGVKGGSFQPGPVLFQETSISSAMGTDLNGDQITDAILVSWLSEKVFVEFGIGRGVFSSAVEVRLPDEPLALGFFSFGYRRPFRLAVSLPKAGSIAYITGAPTGELTLTDVIPVRTAATAMWFGRLDGDSRPDIIASGEGGTSVLSGLSASTFAPPVHFGIGEDERLVQVVDVSGDGLPDLVCADRSSRRLVVVVNGPGSRSGSTEYATGSSPQGVAIADLNRDGKPDITVANNRSASLSLFLNRGAGLFEGQRSIPVADGPMSVHTIAPPESSVTVLLSAHPAHDRLVISRVGTGLHDVASTLIPTGSSPAVLHAAYRGEDRRVSVLVRYGASASNVTGLAWFQEIQRSRFVEHSFRPAVTSTLTAVAAGRRGPSGEPSIVFSTHDRTTLRARLFLASGLTEGEQRGVVPLCDPPDSAAVVSALAFSDVNNDRRDDVVMVQGPPRHALAVAEGGADGSYRLSGAGVADVHPRPGLPMLITDVNGDGLADVLFLDGRKDSLVVSHGVPGGGFGPARGVAPAASGAQFAVAPLRFPLVQDLVLTDPKRHVVRMIFAPFVP